MDLPVIGLFNALALHLIYQYVITLLSSEKKPPTLKASQGNLSSQKT